MPRASSEPLYVSRNHLEGSLCDTSLERVLAACRKHLVTGVVRIHVRGTDGVIELRAGAVDRAQLGDLTGEPAVAAMRSATDGWYEVAQRLPDLTGDLGAAAQLEGDVEGVPLVALMRHCEDNALTCTITVVSGFDRACIEYRAGEITRVELNGFFDDDALPQIVGWPDARFRVAAPPLDLDIEGWPITRRAPTMPFFVGRRGGASASGEIVLGDEATADVLITAPAPVRPTRPRARSTIESSLSALLDVPVEAVPPPPPLAPARAPRATPSPDLVGAPDRAPTDDPIRPRSLPLAPPVAPVLRVETHRTRRRRMPRALTPGYDWSSAIDLVWLVLGVVLAVALVIAALLLLR